MLHICITLLLFKKTCTLKIVQMNFNVKGRVRCFNLFEQTNMVTTERRKIIELFETESRYKLFMGSGSLLTDKQISELRENGYIYNMLHPRAPIYDASQRPLYLLCCRAPYIWELAYWQTDIKNVDWCSLERMVVELQRILQVF